MSDDRSTRATPRTLLRVAAGVLLLGFVLARVDTQQLSIRWDLRTLGGFGATVALLALAQALSALRWGLVLGDPSAGYGYLLRVYLVGTFFSLFLPTSVGGDAVRAVAVSRASKRPAWAVSSVVLERLLGMVALVGILGVGAFAAPAVFEAAVARVSLRWSPSAAQLAVAAAALVAVAAGLARTARGRSLAAKAAQAAGALRMGFAARPGAFAGALGVSVLVQGTYVLAWYLLGASLGLGAPAAEFLVFVPFVSLAAMLPVTVAGIGVREGAWVLLLAPYGVAAADAVAFSLLYFLASVAIGVAGGLVFAVAGTGGPAAEPVAARPAAPERQPAAVS